MQSCSQVAVFSGSWVACGLRAPVGKSQSLTRLRLCAQPRPLLSTALANQRLTSGMRCLLSHLKYRKQQQTKPSTILYITVIHHFQFLLESKKYVVFANFPISFNYEAAGMSTFTFRSDNHKASIITVHRIAQFTEHKRYHHCL